MAIFFYILGSTDSLEMEFDGQTIFNRITQKVGLAVRFTFSFKHPGCFFFHPGRYFLGTRGLYFSTVGSQERGADIQQRLPGPRLEPGTAASRTIASIHGRSLNPYTTSAVPKPPGCRLE
ncbi:hypothetical protein ATANTOWER_011439 [Ataeniobius toweri]|uniref:Uncharacterized protein n=1 Tax=Ataeniobius toweri TaxID=208326 RepID=A0ABU7C7W6_9TELE|nr:hypothetical protein [Ataeniobius toweri]